jgi:hypothetical protein
MRDNIEWKLVEILAIRDAKFFKEEVNDLDIDDKELYDDLAVQQHPEMQTKDQNKMTYVSKYLEEFKEQMAQREKEANEAPAQGFEEGDEDCVMEETVERMDGPLSSEQEMLDSMKYDYYVHYKGIDRRNDRWVTEQFLKVDNKDEIARQQKIFSKDEEGKKDLDNMNREKLFFNDENHGMSERQVQEFVNQTKFKTVESIQFGKYWLETWYFTPLPKEFQTKCLYVCDFCLFFCVHKKELLRHSRKCMVRHPPGDEIYRDNDIAFFEVDGCL